MIPDSGYLWLIITLAVLVVFLGFEIPAVNEKSRHWTTLSEQVRRLPNLVRYAICGFLILLCLHFMPHVNTKLFLVWG